MQRPLINIGQLMTGSFLSRLPYHNDGTFVQNVTSRSATQLWHTHKHTHTHTHYIKLVCLKSTVITLFY